MSGYTRNDIAIWYRKIRNCKHSLRRVTTKPDGRIFIRCNECAASASVDIPDAINRQSKALAMMHKLGRCGCSQEGTCRYCNQACALCERTFFNCECEFGPAGGDMGK